MCSGKVARSFVAHIRLERAASGEIVWRGHIRHVQSQKQKYFKELDEMRDFINSVAGESGAAKAEGRSGK